MLVCLISDTHIFQRNLEIPECDLLLHSGDFTLNGGLTQTEKFAIWFAEQPARYKVVIPGNHDYLAEREPDRVRAIIENDNTRLLIGESTEVLGLKIYGSPWTPWFMNWAYNFNKNDDGTQAQAHWDKIPDDTDILLTHGPPYKKHDRVNQPRHGEDPHVGCKQLLDRVLQVKPILSLFGHIHEGYGTSSNRDTYFCNASMWKHWERPGKHLQEPVLISIDNGLVTRR